MGIVRIIANGVELDYVRQSLKVKKENNAFITDFKASHSSFPFLIIENARTKTALGTRDITSVLKKKVVPVTVLEKGDRYYGELEILSYISGYRKCNLKYGSDLLKIFGKKLSDLLPVISVIPGETDPVPFTDSAIEVVPGYDHWEELPVTMAGKIFPEVDFQFPELAWKDKFFEDAPEEDNEWYWYAGYYNKFNRSPVYFKDNSVDIDGEAGQDITIINQQVPSPQLFLLGILKLAFASAGYTIAGAFTETEFVKRLLVLSTKSNLCKVDIVPATNILTFADFPYAFLFLYDYYVHDFVPEAAGTYEFHYHVKERLYPGGITTQNHRTIMYYNTSSSTLPDETSIVIYKNTNDPDKRVFEDKFSITVDEEEVGNTYKIIWGRYYSVDGDPLEFDIRWSNEGKTFNMMHPTIPLGRYAPDWTLSDYVNEVKKLFCLNIRFDDLARVAHFDYTGDLLKSSLIHHAGKSLALADYAPSSYDAITLKYGNEQDNFLYIDRTGPQLNRKEEGDLILEISSKFKLVPHDSYTSDISTIDSKDGAGLMIYNPGGFEGFQVPITSTEYEGYSLSIEGALGIYDTYWKQTIQFRLYASAVDIEGAFTETEIGKMLAAQKLFVDNQAYIITSIEYTETTQSNYKIKMQLESITL